MGAGLLSKNSVVIGISHSGSNKGLLEALEVAKARGAKNYCDYELSEIGIKSTG